MGCRQIAATAMVGVLLGAGSLLVSSGSASASTTTPRPRPYCSVGRDDGWPGWTSNRPADVDPKSAQGVYMWHDGRGWHIRATHRQVARQVFRGKIVTSGRFFGVSSVRLEGRDRLNVSTDHHVITFRFENHGAIDGLNFHTYCASGIEFRLFSDGQSLAPDAVKIGAGRVTPPSDPFTITRTAPAPVAST